MCEKTMDCDLKSPAVDPARPAAMQDRPYVAVASLEGRFVNEHLGHAGRLFIFGPKGNGYELIGIRPAPSRGGGVQRWRQLGDLLSDCRALLTAAAGTNPVQALQAAGIEVAVVEGPIAPILDAVYGGGDLSVYYPTEGCGCGPSDEGFTLAELMTALAIMAVLLAVLVPSLNAARKAARTLVCQSNLRSSGLAWTPGSPTRSWFLYWTARLPPTLKRSTMMRSTHTRPGRTGSISSST
jgi:prepilin-type N-terminal cleavage/methylation domain-containing protein